MSGPGQGPYGDTGPPDRSDRELAAGNGNETLCFRVALPLATTETVQNQSVTAVFNFVAE